jgi:hypothetical protein
MRCAPQDTAWVHSGSVRRRRLTGNRAKVSFPPDWETTVRFRRPNPAFIDDRCVGGFWRV